MKGKRKWKGEMTKDLTNGYGGTIHKGEMVVVEKKRMLEESLDGKYRWKGKYNYHYTSENQFVRTTQFLLKGQIGDETIRKQN